MAAGPSLALVLLLGLVVNKGVVAEDHQRSFHGYQVFRCLPQTRQDLDFLNDLESMSLGPDAPYEVDFWSEPHRLSAPVDIMVGPDNTADFRGSMESAGLSCDTLMHDVQSVITDSHVQSKAYDNNGDDDDLAFFTKYHTYEEVYDYMEELVALRPEICVTYSIGQTFEGRDMKAMWISAGHSQGNNNKPIIWIDGGMHSREWITVSTATFLMDRLIRGYNKDRDTTTLLNTYDFIVLPVLNVDGYNYSWEKDRMWRKTRSLDPNNNNKRCVGADPNRNWDFHWGEARASTKPCSDAYQGPQAASELEVQTLQNYLYSNKDTILSYINLHSYSQVWTSPYGYTEDRPSDFDDQDAASAAAVRAIEKAHGQVYSHGNIANTVYAASGLAADYAYGECGIKYSYALELRDKGDFGFILPTDQIIPTGEEIFAGLVAMAKTIKKIENL